MIKELIKLANHLDQKGLTKEADFVDSIIKKSQEDHKPKAIEFLNKFVPLMGKPGRENLNAKVKLQEEYGVDRVAKGSLESGETAYQVYFSDGVKVTVKDSELTLQ